MSVRNASVLFLALSTLALLVGCGSSSPKAVPPPSGGFSNSSLTKNGTYVFSGSGTDLVNGSFFAVAGTVVSDGSGGLTGGSFDVVDSFLGVSTGNSVSGGTYKITADGRGTATLPGNLAIDFVLTSSSHGLITRFDNGGTGSGTLDLQGTQTTPAGSYSFSLAGVDSSVNPLNSVGSFTLTGSTISGVQDFNDHYTISSETGLTNLPLSGTLVVGTGTQLATSSTFGNLGTLSFDVFEIDSTHLKFVETDGLDFLAGDAFTQQTTMPPAGQLVFTMAGFDVSGAFLVAGGYLTSDGASLITTGIEDVNDAGGTGQATGVTGNFVSTGGGRFTITLSGIFNGGASVSTYTFAAYPTVNGGIQLLEIDGIGITSGAAYAQSSTTLSTPQGYGLNLTGVDLNTGNEVDDIAEFTAQNGGLTGIVDINDGGPIFNQTLGSGDTYILDSPATGRGEISTAPFGLIFYVVDSSTSIFIQSDNTGEVALGTFELQTTPTPGAAQPTISTFHPIVRPHPALRRKH
jgi:hypothetical protein